MKLEDQVLSVEQVRELQELGFDVEKHSSIKSNGKKVVAEDGFYIGGAPLFPTMTIGDIIDVLPLYIKGKGNNTYWRVINYNGILYYRSEQVDWVFNTHYEKPNKPLIEALFETLKWCIKEKYINLK
jgi:hypothetical protein